MLAYRLDLPSSLARVHPVMHVSVLKRYRVGGRVPPPPPAWDPDELGALYEVEAVLDYRPPKGKRGKPKYLIKWSGYGHQHNIWEPEWRLNKAAVESYWARHPLEAASPGVLVPAGE
jgi:hypothetical protein